MILAVRTTAWGEMAFLEEEGALVALKFPGAPLPQGMPSGTTPLLESAFRQLDEYLAGKRHAFSLPLRAVGTPFQEAVWAALAAIPYGTTVGYGELAWRLGTSGGARAVGMACHRNPLPILVPCHRVVGAGGRLTGFGGGLPMKKALLDLESGALAFPEGRWMA